MQKCDSHEQKSGGEMCRYHNYNVYSIKQFAANHIKL